MVYRLKQNVICLLLAGLMSVLSADGSALAADIQSVSTKTLAKDKFLFPTDLSARKLNVLFLGIADEQEVGQQQGDQLLAWHAELESQGAFSPGVVPYHFPVMAGVPFFVKGLISRAMRDVYEDKVPLGQVAVLHIDNTAEFSASIGVPNDQQPTIALMSAEGEVIRLFHGGSDSIAIAEVAAAIRFYADAEASTP